MNWRASPFARAGQADNGGLVGGVVASGAKLSNEFNEIESLRPASFPVCSNPCMERSNPERCVSARLQLSQSACNLQLNQCVGKICWPPNPGGEGRLAVRHRPSRDLQFRTQSGNFWQSRSFRMASIAINGCRRWTPTYCLGSASGRSPTSNREVGRDHRPIEADLEQQERGRAARVEPCPAGE